MHHYAVRLRSVKGYCSSSNILSITSLFSGLMELSSSQGCTKERRRVNTSTHSQKNNGAWRSHTSIQALLFPVGCMNCSCTKPPPSISLKQRGKKLWSAEQTPPQLIPAAAPTSGSPLTRVDHSTEAHQTAQPSINPNKQASLPNIVIKVISFDVNIHLVLHVTR